MNVRRLSAPVRPGRTSLAGLNDTLTHVYTLRDTYITDAISRVVTTVQNALNLDA